MGFNIFSVLSVSQKPLKMGCHETASTVKRFCLKPKWLNSNERQIDTILLVAVLLCISENISFINYLSHDIVSWWINNLWGFGVLLKCSWNVVSQSFFWQVASANGKLRLGGWCSVLCCLTHQTVTDAVLFQGLISFCKGSQMLPTTKNTRLKGSHVSEHYGTVECTRVVNIAGKI